jgi:hypothetical protein
LLLIADPQTSSKAVYMIRIIHRFVFVVCFIPAVACAGSIKLVYDYGIFRDGAVLLLDTSRCAADSNTLKNAGKTIKQVEDFFKTVMKGDTVQKDTVHVQVKITGRNLKSVVPDDSVSKRWYDKRQSKICNTEKNTRLSKTSIDEVDIQFNYSAKAFESAKQENTNHMRTNTLGYLIVAGGILIINVFVILPAMRPTPHFN